jgi:hypothetical protein
MSESANTSNDVYFETDRPVDPHSLEGAQTLLQLFTDILEQSPSFDASKVDLTFDDTSGCYKGSIFHYDALIQPNEGMIVLNNSQTKVEMEESYTFESIEGALGWLLCKVGYGDNLFRYETYSFFFEPSNGLPGIYTAMEREPNEQEKRYYEKIMTQFRESSGMMTKEGGPRSDAETTDLADLFSVSEDKIETVESVLGDVSVEKEGDSEEHQEEGEEKDGNEE